MQDQVAELLRRREGHFRFESGHHGNLWLDLEKLCLFPRKVELLAAALAERLAPAIEPHRSAGAVICGPLVEGAFIAMAVARHLDVAFTYAERLEKPGQAAHALFPVEYPIPKPLHETLRGAPVVIVNDVINAGSAVRGTLNSLRRSGRNRSRSGAWRPSVRSPLDGRRRRGFPSIRWRNLRSKSTNRRSALGATKGSRSQIRGL